MLRRTLRSLFVLAVVAGLASGSLAQTLTIAQGTDPLSLDAHIPTDSPAATVTSHIFETLYRWDAETGQILPHLATDATMSDDGLVWTLTLRDDVTFHNGMPFNAEVVKGSMERLLDPATAAPFAFILNRIQSMEAVGEHTIQFTLSTPFAPFLAHLTHSGVAIVHPDVVAEYGERHNSEPVGTGPFRVESWERQNRVNLVRNENYWGTPPAIERLVFLTVPEATTRAAMIESGEADAARVPPQDVARLNANPNVTVTTTSGVRTIFIYFNHTEEPFTDVRVRQAINHAVNMEEIAEFVHAGTARPSDAAIAPGIFGYTPVGRYAYDPERARQLLAEVGINASIETMEWNAYIAMTGRPVDENEITMAMLGWGTVTGDADYGLYALFHTSQHPPVGFNRGFYSNPEIDSLLDDARSTNDPVLRESLYSLALQILRDDAAWLFLYSEAQIVAIRDEVKGLIIHPTERLIAYNATKN
jgi:ABC-type transport system substrate-binding protein